MALKGLGDLVNLFLHVLIARKEIGKGRDPPGEPFPPRTFAPHVQFTHGETPDRGHHRPQTVAGGANVLVLDVGQHGLGNLL